MYSFHAYGEMIRDQVRVRAFREALAEVAPGKRVLEIGGGTGFFACLASKLGAADVVSIELSPAIQMGPRTAALNGVENVRFVHGRSQDYRAKELADVLLHDLRGHTPFYQNGLSTIKDAYRLLKPEAVLLPKRDVVYGCLVEDEPFYREMESIWGGTLEGIDLTALRADSHRILRYTPSEQGRAWSKHALAAIDYRKIEQTDLETSFSVVADRDGISHGLALWFETFLTETVHFSNDPWLPAGERGSTYGVSFLPWPDPVRMEAGRTYRVEVKISGRGYSSGRLYLQGGALQPLLASFSSGGLYEEGRTLPLQSRFVEDPKIKRYRCALQAMERGDTVEQALEAIAKTCPEVSEPETALETLLESLQLVQGRWRRLAEQRQVLAFAEARFELQTWDTALQADVLKRLSPSWRKVKSKKGGLLTLSLEQTAQQHGTFYVVGFRDKRTLHETRDEALSQLESYVNQIVLPELSGCVVVDCGYFLTPSGACLVVGDDLIQRRALCESSGTQGSASAAVLSKDGRLLPYRTGGGSLACDPVAVSEIAFLGPPLSLAQSLAFLLGRCWNNPVTGNPVAYFQQLLAGAQLRSLAAKGGNH